MPEPKTLNEAWDDLGDALWEMFRMDDLMTWTARAVAWLTAHSDTQQNGMVMWSRGDILVTRLQVQGLRR